MSGGFQASIFKFASDLFAKVCDRICIKASEERERKSLASREERTQRKTPDYFGLVTITSDGFQCLHQGKRFWDGLYQLPNDRKCSDVRGSLLHGWQLSKFAI